MKKRGGDICCVEEDRYLLGRLRAYVRSNPNKHVNLGQVLEHLYECLEPFLEERGINLDDVDLDAAFVELEKRVLRWINRKDISINAISGLAICESCGCMIMRGRTVCNSCLRAKEITQARSSWTSSEGRYIPRGMHFKIR